MANDKLLKRYKIVPPEDLLAIKLRNWLGGPFLGVLRVVMSALQELRPQVRIPLRNRWRGWRLGFRAASYALYGLDGRDASDYLTDYAILRYGHRINGMHRFTVLEKLNFADSMKQYGLPHPDVYAYLDKGCIYSLDGTALPRDWNEALRGLLATRGRLVMKPSANGSGRGIIFVEQKGEQLVMNGEAISERDWEDLVSSLQDFLVMQFVEQAAYARALYPLTTNTVRVLTLWDMDRQEPFIASGAHRIGTKRSFPVDNFHGGEGGLSASIQIDTGVLGPARTLNPIGVREEVPVHPETGAPIEGVQIPYWEEVKKTLLHCSRHLPHIPFIGWDLVITEGGWTCIEGNAPPGVVVWQVHQPLLEDPRARKFFESHGAVRSS